MGLFLSFLLALNFSFYRNLSMSARVLFAKIDCILFI